jgi:subtilisin-like proprotein convertase family protein
MKNRFYKKICVFMMSLALALGLSYTVKADIVNPVVTATPQIYASGGSLPVVFTVTFSSATIEWLDAVEFNPPAGFSLIAGPADLGQDKCNMGVFATPMPSSVDPMNGISWGNAMFPMGGSTCGPYATDITYNFVVVVNDMANSIGDQTVNVVLYGDGFGEMTPTSITIPIVLAGPPCVITCPPDFAVSNDPGECGADVTIGLPSDNGFCQTLPTNMDGFYPVGTTPVTFTADAGVECTVNVTVNDVEDPVITNCNDITVDLDPGECEAIVNFSIDATDNCSTLPVSLSHNVDPNTYTDGFVCFLGSYQTLQVFDLGSNSVNNDFDISSVNLGILVSDGVSSATVNIYELNGPLNYSNLTLLGTNTATVPAMSAATYSFPVAATAAGGSTIVVEVVLPNPDINLLVLAVNSQGSTGETYFASNACGLSQPASYTSQGVGFYTALISVEGEEQALGYTNLDGSGLTSGDFFPIGVTDLTINVTDASGNSASCEFSVTINEYSNPVTSITCNDNVQISLDDQCTTIVGADLILEGGPYGCYEDFIVEIGYPNGTNHLNPADQLDYSHTGMTMPVIVTDENGNSCWGQIVVEDKVPVELECEDINTVCSESTDPGAPLASRVLVTEEPGTVISTFGPSENDVVVNVSGQNGATVNDLNVSIDISHTWVGDLTATITSPSGSFATLFIGAGFGCAGDDIFVTIDDEALNTSLDYQLTCEPTPPSISGSFQPVDPLSIFDGEDLNGNWTIKISDLLGGDGGTINSITLDFGQSGGTVVLPIPDGATYFPSGNVNEFTVLGFDPCGPVTLSYFDNVQTNDCSNEYSEVISRTWNATDPNGNISDQCVQTIFVHRNDLSTLQFPLNRDDLALPALRFLTAFNCEPTWILLENGYPSPESTGEPTGELCENHQITYDDTEIDICGPIYLWWCS